MHLCAAELDQGGDQELGICNRPGACDRALQGADPGIGRPCGYCGRAGLELRQGPGPARLSRTLQQRLGRSVQRSRRDDPDFVEERLGDQLDVRSGARGVTRLRECADQQLVTVLVPRLEAHQSARVLDGLIRAS